MTLYDSDGERPQADATGGSRLPISTADGKGFRVCQIEDVIIRFAVSCDESEFAGVAEMLTDDVELAAPGQGLLVGPGRDLVLAHAKAATAARAARGERGRHLITNVRVDMAPDGSATARSYVTFVVTSADGTAGIFAFATYEDRFVRVGEAWKLAARRMTFDRDELTAAYR